MPRYFFHVNDGDSGKDELGTELADIYAAQDVAVRTSGELLRELGGKFWNGGEWSMEVTDEAGQVLLILRFSAQEGPDLGRPSSAP